MDNQCIISFCIPVYNQSDLVRKCIAGIISYIGEEIEIVVSDDCSSENIFSIIQDFNDARIKYYRNEQNLGHDLNILKMLERASGEYAFLLRTRDYVIPSEIPKVVNILKRAGKVSYITGAALDNLGQQRLVFKNSSYICGHETVSANHNLFTHPSGNIYHLKDLKLSLIEDFYNKQNMGNRAFVIHSMIRSYLATKGDFLIIRKPIWIYPYTLEQNDVAENKIKNGVSVYDPELQYSRYKCEFYWDVKICPQDLRVQMLSLLIDKYIELVTWEFKSFNSDERAHKHYSFNQRPFNIFEESKKIYKYSRYLIVDSRLKDFEKKQLLRHLKRQVNYNYFMGRIKYYCKIVLRGSITYKKAGILYRRFVKKT